MKKWLLKRNCVQSIIKGYLRYETILCNGVALDAQLMIFFIWRENNVAFLRYLDYCDFVKSTDLKICDVIIGIATQWKLHLCLFLLNPKYYGNGFVQMLLCCMTKISNMFCLIARAWKLIPSHFMILLKWQYSQVWPFLLVDTYHLQMSFIHLFKKWSTGILI